MARPVKPLAVAAWRPRRVGWLDMPTLRHAATASGFTGLAINHVDTLAGLDTVKVAHAYDLNGEELPTVPGTTERWADCEPVYREFDGWPDPDWSAVADSGYDDIPAAAQEYLGYIAAELDADIYAVGVGPGREDTVVVGDPFDNACDDHRPQPRTPARGRVEIADDRVATAICVRSRKPVLPRSAVTTAGRPSTRARCARWLPRPGPTSASVRRRHTGRAHRDRTVRPGRRSRPDRLHHHVDRPAPSDRGPFAAVGGRRDGPSSSYGHRDHGCPILLNNTTLWSVTRYTTIEGTNFRR